MCIRIEDPGWAFVVVLCLVASDCNYCYCREECDYWLLWWSSWKILVGNKSSVVMTDDDDDVKNNDRRGHSFYAEHWRVDCAPYYLNWSSLERSPIQPLVENTSAAAASFHYRQRRKKARRISYHHDEHEAAAAWDDD